MNQADWVPKEEILNNVLEVLQDSFIPDNAVQQDVQQKLSSLQSNADLINYFLLIFDSNHLYDEKTRALAGVILKNNISYVFDSTSAHVIHNIKLKSLKLLSDPSCEVRSSASALITVIALKGGLENWPELLPQILNLLESPDYNESMIKTLINICEDYLSQRYQISLNLQDSIKKLLLKFINLTSNSSKNIQKHSFKILNDALQKFYSTIKNDFDSSAYIQRLIQSANDPDEEIIILVCQGFVIYINNKDEAILPLINDVIKYMLIKTVDENDEVALQACEFWFSMAKLPTCKEILGGCLEELCQILLKNMRKCPKCLISPLIKIVIDEMRKVCKKNPVACGYNPSEDAYEPLKLMQTVILKTNEICLRYLDNSMLCSLPSPGPPYFPVSACAVKNLRRRMEDRHVVVHDLNTIFNDQEASPSSYYAIFDGHAGHDAAAYSAAHLHQYLAESKYFSSNPEQALIDAFCKTDALFIEKCKVENLSSGTTAVCALVRPKEKSLYIAWVGDSQAVLANQGSILQCVNPHKPDREDEKERIEKHGGIVVYWGTWRVNGQLAVSRAIGDSEYKPFVIAVPDVREIPLSGSEDFLILACDGLWDCISEKDAAKVVYKMVCDNPDNTDSISQRLVQLSKQQGSTDNISVIVVFLREPSKIAAEAQWATRTEFAVNAAMEAGLDNANAANPFSNSNGTDILAHKETNFMLNLDDFNSSGTNGKDYFMDNSANGKRSSSEFNNDEDMGPETDVDTLDDVATITTQVVGQSNDSTKLSSDDNLKGTCTSNELLAEICHPFSNTTTNVESKLLDEETKADTESESDEVLSELKEESDKNTPETEKSDLMESASAKLNFGEESSITNKIEAEMDLYFKNHAEGAMREETPTPPADEVHDAGLVDNVADSGEDSEDEWNYIKGDTDPEKPVPNTLAEVTQVSESSEDNMSQLNPDAAEFVPISPTRTMESPVSRFLKEDPVIAQSPRRIVDIDINVPNQGEFEKEVKSRPSDVISNGHENGHRVPSSELMENIWNGKDIDEIEFQPSPVKSNEEMFHFGPNAAPFSPGKFLDQSEALSTNANFGDESTDIGDETSDLLGDKCLDSPVQEVTSTSNPFSDPQMDSPDFQGLNKEQDPMSMSFYQDKEDESTNPFDLNKVQVLPNNVDEYLDKSDETFNETISDLPEHQPLQDDVITTDLDKKEDDELMTFVCQLPKSPLLDVKTPEPTLDENLCADTATEKTEDFTKSSEPHYLESSVGDELLTKSPVDVSEPSEEYNIQTSEPIVDTKTPEPTTDVCVSPAEVSELAEQLTTEVCDISTPIEESCAKPSSVFTNQFSDLDMAVNKDIDTDFKQFETEISQTEEEVEQQVETTLEDLSAEGQIEKTEAASRLEVELIPAKPKIEDLQLTQEQELICIESEIRAAVVSSESSLTEETAKLQCNLSGPNEPSCTTEDIFSVKDTASFEHLAEKSTVHDLISTLSEGQAENVQVEETKLLELQQEVDLHNEENIENVVPEGAGLSEIISVATATAVGAAVVGAETVAALSEKSDSNKEIPKGKKPATTTTKSAVQVSTKSAPKPTLKPLSKSAPVSKTSTAKTVTSPIKSSTPSTKTLSKPQSSALSAKAVASKTTATKPTTKTSSAKPQVDKKPLTNGDVKTSKAALPPIKKPSSAGTTTVTGTATTTSRFLSASPRAPSTKTSSISAKASEKVSGKPSSASAKVPTRPPSSTTTTRALGTKSALNTKVSSSTAAGKVPTKTTGTTAAAPKPKSVLTAVPPKPRVPMSSRPIAKAPDTEKQNKENVNKLTASRTTSTKSTTISKISSSASSKKLEMKASNTKTTPTKTTQLRTTPKKTDTVKNGTMKVPSKTTTTKVSKPKENGIANGLNPIASEQLSTEITTNELEPQLLKDLSPIENKIIDNSQLAEPIAD